MFEVLMFLFKRHMMRDNSRLPLTEDKLIEELQDAGFHDDIIDKALDWLEDLLVLQECSLEQITSANTIRLFSSEEYLKLNVKIRGFMLFLEQIGILTAGTRELVINRLMAIEDDRITLTQVKWVVLLVLFNQPNAETALAFMEQMVLAQHGGTGSH